MNAIDLTTVDAVKNWCGITNTTTTQDQTIQDQITALSASVLHMTGRGPQDGSVPAASPFVAPVSYDDFYDGSGTDRQAIRNWPITAVTAVNINGLAIPQSSSVSTSGWVVDGDKKFISLRGGMAPTVATFQNYRYQGGYGFGRSSGFSSGVQNVEVQYTAGYAATPADLEMAVRKTVSLYFKRRGWIGQNSQAMAQGAGTVMYNNFEFSREDYTTIMYYKSRVA